MTQPLLIDLYPRDRHLDCDTLCAAGRPWVGVIAKASQGTRYHYDEWLRDLVRRFRAAARGRYGIDLFDGHYAYLDLAEAGAPQVDVALDAIEGAGGEGAGTLPLMLDVERGGQEHPDKIGRAQVEDVTRAASARYFERTGREATLYGGEFLRSMGVTDRLGCARSATALYGPRLGGRVRDLATGLLRDETTAEFLVRTGTDVSHLMLWQYAEADGTPTTPPPGYPIEAPGIGRVDLSAATLPGGIDALRALCRPRPA